jgi:hypothetical protein
MRRKISKNLRETNSVLRICNDLIRSKYVLEKIFLGNNNSSVEKYSVENFITNNFIVL